MSKFLEYLILVAKRTFSGADGIASVVGVIALFFFGYQFPALSWYSYAVLFISLVFYGTFKVWKDQKAITDEMGAELGELKNSIPVFEIGVGEVKQFTVAALIQESRGQLSKAQAKVERAQAARQGAASNALFSALESLKSMTVLPGMYRSETPEEEVERLSDYLKKLEAYEAKLSRTYRVELDIKGSRYDEDIEVWVKSELVEKMIVDDDYLKNSLPTQRRRTDYLYALPGGNLRVHNINSLYSASFGDSDGAYSKIKSLNASRLLHLFEGELYIRTDKPEKEVVLHVEVRSQRLIKPQNEDITVHLTDAPIEEVLDYDPSDT